MVDPGTEPASDVSAARHRGQIIEVAQQILTGQALQDAQTKGRAANAAPGQAEGGARPAMQESADSVQAVPDSRDGLREGFFQQDPVEDFQRLALEWRRGQPLRPSAERDAPEARLLIDRF